MWYNPLRTTGQTKKGTKTMNITYTATGRKNSKKNPATIILNIDSVEIKLEYTKKNGWMPSEDMSVRGLNLYCEFVTKDKAWNTPALQNFISAVHNLETSWNRDAAMLRWVECYAQWKYSFSNDEEVIIWKKVA